MERVGESTGSNKRAAGRKDAAKTPAVMDETKLRDELPRLKKLLVTKDEATDDFNSAVTKVAEKSGYLASVVAKTVKAWASDDFEEKKREVEQLSLAFEAASKA